MHLYLQRIESKQKKNAKVWTLIDHVLLLVQTEIMYVILLEVGFDILFFTLFNQPLEVPYLVASVYTTLRNR